jgi:hypothetical protein
MSARLCPVCRRAVVPTRGRNIVGHVDKAGTVCIASGEPYYITLLSSRKGAA